MTVMELSFEMAGSRSLLRQVASVARYEFRMQLRRPAVWLVLGILGAWEMRLLIDDRGGPLSPSLEAPSWAWLLQVLCPIAIGVLLADRFPRDRRLGVGELLNATPAGETTRLLGKYLGATAATTVPMLIVYAIGCAWLAGRSSDPGAVLLNVVPAFLLINLPGLLFIAAYSVCCPIVMRVPLYQFLFVGYWFWGNFMPPAVMPTLRDTWLAPIGIVAEQGFFNVYQQAGVPAWSLGDAIGSIVLLLALAVAALVAGAIALRWQRRAA